MARTAITITEMEGPFATISADDVNITWEAADTGNKNSLAATGKEILLAWNTDGATPYNVSIDSAADEKNRTGDISSYELAAGEIGAFSVGLTSSKGWIQTGQIIHFEASNAAIEFAVLRIP